MEELITTFVAGLMADGAPQSTVNAYRTDVMQFRAFLERKGMVSGEHISTAEMVAFCEWLRGQGYAEATIARRVTSLRAFGAFLVQNGWAGSNPGDGLQPPVRVRSEQTPLTGEQIHALLQQPLQEQTPGTWRDYALLALLTTTGLRVSDLLALDLADLDLERNYVLLHNGEHYTLPLRVVMALATYLSLCRPRLLGDHVGEQALFLNQRGQRLTRQGCWTIVKHYALKLKLHDVSLERLRLSLLAA